LKKKRILLAQWTLFSFALLVMIFFTACRPAFERFQHLISELRDNVFIAESENYSVYILSGRREEPFIMDGHAGTMRDYTLITLEPKTCLQTHTFKAVINGTEYSGQFVAHPFAKSFSAEIAVAARGAHIALTVLCGGTEETLNAVSVLTENMISAEKAVEIAEKKLRDSIDMFRANGTLQCEIYVRLMANPIDNSGGYYWYVAFIGANQTIFAVLIEPVTMQILAIRD